MEEKKLPKVSIIILNYNGWRDTITCLESVFNIDYNNFTVILVDAGSNDNSLLHLKKWAETNFEYTNDFPEHPHFRALYTIKKPLSFVEYDRQEYWKKHEGCDNLYEEIFTPKKSTHNKMNTKLVFIDTKENLGFAGGNNVGIRFSLNYINPDYIIILNNDTVVLDNLIDKLLEVFRMFDKAGLCGPLEYSYRKPYNIQSSGGRFNLYTGRNIILKSSSQMIKEVDWVVGSCMMIKKDLFFEIGYFDERFFLYVEEVDYAYRVKKGGYKVFVTPNTCIWHKGGTKGGKTFDEVYFLYVMRNRVLFALKHLKFHQKIIFFLNHFKKLFTFSLRDFIVNKRLNFFKRVSFIKNGFDVYKENLKKYDCIIRK